MPCYALEDYDIEIGGDKSVRVGDNQAHVGDKVIVSDGKFITEKAAVQIAMKQAKGTVTNIELDKDDGRVIYEIEIKDGKYEYDFDIDAISGKVLKFEKDRDDNDND